MRRISKLESDLKQLKKNRATQSKSRKRTNNHGVAIVGYTNAGKSTLLNSLTNAGVLVEDRLFATLDATTRRLQLPGGEKVYLTDTVGFVRKLPHQLVEAFTSTLDVVIDADLLIHVVDSSDPDPKGSIAAVHSVLREIGADGITQIYAFNKADLDQSAAQRLVRQEQDAVAVSAATGEGLEDLLKMIGEHLRELSQVIELFIPYDRGDVLAKAHREGQVLEEVPEERGWKVSARLGKSSVGRLEEFMRG